MRELLDRGKTEKDLIEVLERYPNLQVIERRYRNALTIIELDPKSGIEKRVIDVFVVYNKDLKNKAKMLFPYISCYHPNNNSHTYIELHSNGLKVEGEEKNPYEILEITHGGLEIMEVYKQLDSDTKENIEHIYWDRVYTEREESDNDRFIHDYLGKTLERTRIVLNK